MDALEAHDMGGGYFCPSWYVLRVSLHVLMSLVDRQCPTSFARPFVEPRVKANLFMMVRDWHLQEDGTWRNESGIGILSGQV